MSLPNWDEVIASRPVCNQLHALQVLNSTAKVSPTLGVRLKPMAQDKDLIVLTKHKRITLSLKDAASLNPLSTPKTLIQVGLLSLTRPNSKWVILHVCSFGIHLIV